MTGSELYGIALWLVVGWPLLLVLPVVRRQLPCPHYLAVMPAALLFLSLLLSPGTVSLNLPWLLFDTALSMDDDRRWLLLMTVVIWLLAAPLERHQRLSGTHWQSSLYLLTLAGSLGVVMADDLVGFFSFSTLMGYGFYGLLIQPGNALAGVAARRYLICLVIADLLLFEALLLAAFYGESLQFSVLAEAMTGSSVLPLYLLMVFAAFALKVGFWPLHFWLHTAYRSASPLSFLLLVLPVALGLFGLVRWLPLGAFHDQTTAITLQIFGAAAMLYAALRWFHSVTRPAWQSLFASGLVIFLLGAGIANSLWWQQHGAALIYPVIATVGIALALLRGNCSPSSTPLPSSHIADLFRLISGETFCGCRSIYQRIAVACSGDHWRWAGKCYRSVNKPWFTPLLASWCGAITLFVLLGITLAWLVD